MLWRMPPSAPPAAGHDKAPDSAAPFMERVDFLVELARRLHMYGTSAQRLEGAVAQVAQRLRVEAEVWSNPTGLILSYPDPERGAAFPLTRVIRLEPGAENLARLAAADGIAEDVLAGRRHIADGLLAMRALDRPETRLRQLAMVLSFGLASASVTGLMRNPGWADLITAALLGIMIGLLTEASMARPSWPPAPVIKAFKRSSVFPRVSSLRGPWRTAWFRPCTA